ncbi:MAG: histidine kinase [Saprospiraceae bacterium]|nr:histidine kinase [Saprospiraceae bacterium]MBK8853243.1 histidine kinase [Saprospiraceae bacterium]
MASLQSFAINETDSMAIAENLSKFSHIMRETLENTYREYNSIQQEIDFMTEYLELQQMRFPNKFTFEILNSVSDSDSILIPSMIVQPFVENSVEHGFANIDYKGFIELEFSQQGGNTVVKISDNGRGLGHQSLKSKPYISRASQIIKDRIYLLNLKLKTNAQFSIQNNDKSEKGVNILITLPEIYDHENLSHR